MDLSLSAQKVKERIKDKKWKSLEKRGIKPPKTEAERIKRLKDAHGY